MKHKTEDYKNSAVQYYLKNNDNIRKTCKIFNCKKSTLQRWIQRYKKYKNTTRRSRKSVSYKVKKEQVKSALKMADENEQLTMEELLFEMKNKYRDFDISRQHLGRIIRTNNRTRKRTRHQHFPKERRKQPTNKSKEFEDFYNEVKKYSLNKIICLDETSIGSHLKPSYSRCYIGNRCIIKTDNNFVFRSFTLLVAINNSKCVGKIFYEKGSLPVISKEFINNAMKVICGEKEEKRGKPPKKETMELKNKLTSFYNEHYLPTTQNDPIDYAGLNTVLDYLKEDVITMYENNIQLHYVEYVERFVNVVWKKKMITEKIRKIYKTKKERENRIRTLCSELRKIKNDLLNVDTIIYTSKSYYHQWIKEQKRFILPNKKKYEKNSIYYDLKCKTMDYFPCMIMMMKQIELEEESINNVFPLRSEIIPKYIRLDTTTLVNLLLRKEQGNKSFYKTEGNLKKNEDKIWEFFFLERNENHMMKRISSYDFY